MNKSFARSAEFAERDMQGHAHDESICLNHKQKQGVSQTHKLIVLSKAWLATEKTKGENARTNRIKIKNADGFRDG